MPCMALRVIAVFQPCLPVGLPASSALALSPPLARVPGSPAHPGRCFPGHCCPADTQPAIPIRARTLHGERIPLEPVQLSASPELLSEWISSQISSTLTSCACSPTSCPHHGFRSSRQPCRAPPAPVPSPSPGDFAPCPVPGGDEHGATPAAGRCGAGRRGGGTPRRR